MVSFFGKTKAKASTGPAKHHLVELDWTHTNQSDGVNMKILGIESFADIDSVLEALRDQGNIVIMKLKQTFFKDKEEVRRAIRRIQKTTYALGGDIVGLNEDLILVTPSQVTIERPEKIDGASERYVEDRESSSYQHPE